MALRKQGAAGKKGRKEKSFVASRSSNGPRAASECSTHKETDAHIVAAARAAGFLTAVSASGILAHVEELMCAEPLSQRHRFLAIVAAHMPDLKIVVHDDARRLRLVAEKSGEGTAVAARPTALLSKFPTNICEIMNSELSPLGHVVHHVGRWASQFYVQEMVDASNMKTLGRMRGAQATAARKVARASEAASASAEKKPSCSRRDRAVTHCAAMAGKNTESLSQKQVKKLFARAMARVASEFSPAEHLPPKVREFLEPIVNTTCQGYCTSALMVGGPMAALTNGAAVKIWSQKPTPLIAPVFQIGNAQAGKSQLFSVCEEIFDTCDDVIGEHVDSFNFTEFFYRCSSGLPLVDFSEGDGRVAEFRQSDVRGGRAFNLDEAYEFWDGLGLLATGRGGGGGGGGEKDRAPTVHASTLNTFIASGKTRRATRTSATFGESRGKRVSVSLLGNGHPGKFIAMDRGIVGNHTACTKERFVACIDQAAARHAALPAGSRLPRGVSAWAWLPLAPQQAQTFNWETYLDAPEAAAQYLERDTETGEASAANSQARSFVGPAGGYKVEFPDGEESRLRYLRVTPSDVGDAQLRTEFRISNRGDLPDPTGHIQAGARRVAELFAKKPQAILPFEEGARNIMTGNQVAQSIRAQLRGDDDPTLAALEANAAGQQGVQAALVAVLDYSGGGGTLDAASGLPLITTQHVQCARRMLDISIAIRTIWRAALDEDGDAADGESDGDNEPGRLARPVRGHYHPHAYAAPLSTQVPACPAAPQGPVPAGGLVADVARPAARAGGGNVDVSQPASPGAAESDLAGAPPTGGEAPGSGERALTFADLAGEAQFDNQGLGEGGAMVFTKAAFKDRELIRRVLLTGKSQISVDACVDLYSVAVLDQEAPAKRKRRARPSKPEAVAVLKAAFEQFPRLGECQEQNGEVFLKGWPDSELGRALFHNELMRCCRVSLRQLSQKRAQFHEGRPQLADATPSRAAGPPAQPPPSRGARASDAGAAPDAQCFWRRGAVPSTPPGGLH
ncbi:unnamed protein product [Prorocentrum cordatum]|uniref:Kinesin motor domain-containing protein n=1 Tax=Prorocentrum cordatum TaxID=2364126 RepID=A0ABN9RGD9_9DINO|nr:unnamed protein product [Polarella glacialis]